VEKRDIPTLFTRREAFVTTWASTTEEIPIWRPSEIRRYKALVAETKRVVGVARQALALLDEMESGEGETTGEEAQDAGSGEEVQGAGEETSPGELADMFAWVMDNVTRTLHSGASLEEKMTMLSLMQGRGS